MRWGKNFPKSWRKKHLGPDSKIHANPTFTAHFQLKLLDLWQKVVYLLGTLRPKLLRSRSYGGCLPDLPTKGFFFLQQTHSSREIRTEKIRGHIFLPFPDNQKFINSVNFQIGGNFAASILILLNLTCVGTNWVLEC